MFLEEEKKGIEGKFYELCMEVVSSVNLSLYDMEFVKSNKTLRLYIMNENTNTATLEECVSVDRAFSPFIESHAWIPESLVLEVSSPGMFRKLKTYNHFVKAQGAMIDLYLSKDLKTTNHAKNKQSRNGKKIRAMIKAVNKQDIEIEFDGENLVIDFNEIKKANLSPDINF